MARAVLVLVLAPLVALLVAAAVPLPSDPPAEHRWQTSLVWGDRVFVDEREFDAWLRARDGSYARWASLHPHAAARLEGRPPPASRRARQRDVVSDGVDRAEAALALAVVAAALSIPLLVVRLVPSLALRDAARTKG